MLGFFFGILQQINSPLDNAFKKIIFTGYRRQ